jgi:hypothetical protein
MIWVYVCCKYVFVAYICSHVIWHSYGANPYNDFKSVEMRRHLKDGMRLQPPENVCYVLYLLVSSLFSLSGLNSWLVLC